MVIFSLHVWTQWQNCWGHWKWVCKKPLTQPTVPSRVSDRFGSCTVVCRQISTWFSESWNLYVNPRSVSLHHVQAKLQASGKSFFFSCTEQVGSSLPSLLCCYDAMTASWFSWDGVHECMLNHSFNFMLLCVSLSSSNNLFVYSLSLSHTWISSLTQTSYLYHQHPKQHIMVVLAKVIS